MHGSLSFGALTGSHTLPTSGSFFSTSSVSSMLPSQSSSLPLQTSRPAEPSATHTGFLASASQAILPGQPPSVVHSLPRVAMSSTVPSQSLSTPSQASCPLVPAFRHSTLLPLHAYVPFVHCPVPQSGLSSSQHGWPT